MATRTVHTLAWKLLVDNKDFLEGTKANKKEINMAKREMRAMLTPAEKMEMSLQKLGELAKKDARFQEVYNKKLEQFSDNLRKAGKNASGFTRVGPALKNTFFNLQSAAAVLAGGSVARSIGNQVAQFDDLAKTARQAGTSVEFLSQMQFAAGQMIGFSGEQTSRAISQMARRVGEATMGLGEAKTVLEEFGVNIEQLRGKSPEQVFRVLEEALRDVNDAQQLNVIGGKLFGEEMTRMIQLVKNADGATDSLRQQGVELGVAFDSVTTDKMEALSDSFGELNTVFSSFSRSFAESIGPSLTTILREMTSALNALRPETAGGQPNAVNRSTTAGDAFGAVTRMLGSNAQAVQQLDASKLRGFWQVFDEMDDLRAERIRREQSTANDRAAQQTQIELQRRQAEASETMARNLQMGNFR